MLKPILFTTLLLGASACQGTRSNVSERDQHGNYITTSDYEAMQRDDFLAAMGAGLQDFDQRMADLRERANELGGDSLSDFAEWTHDLDSKRTAFQNELEKARATLVGGWPDQRADTLDAYYELRECLDEAYDEVLD